MRKTPDVDFWPLFTDLKGTDLATAFNSFSVFLRKLKPNVQRRALLSMWLEVPHNAESLKQRSLMNCAATAPGHS